MCWQHAWRNTLVLVHYAFNFLLCLIIGLEAYLLLSDDVEIPRLVRGRLEKTLSDHGIAATFQSAHFDPAGRIVVRGLEFGPAHLHESILTADLAFIQLDRIKLLAGIPEPAHIKAEGVRVLCPPTLSPSGVTETLLDVAGLDVVYDGEIWRIKGAVARANDLRVVAQGEFIIPPPQPDEPPPDLTELWRAYAEHAPGIAQIRGYLQHFDEPRLDLTFSSLEPESFSVAAELSAASWKAPELADVQQPRLSVSGAMRFGEWQPIHLTARLAEVRRADVATAADIQVSATWNALPTREAFLPQQVQLSAAHVSHQGQQIESPVVMVRDAGWPRVTAEAQVLVGGEVLNLQARGDVLARSGEVDLHGRFGRDWLERASEFLGRDVTYYATIETPPAFDAHAVVPSDIRQASVDFRVLSGPLVARGVRLDRARVRGQLTAEKIRLEHLEISQGDQHMVGTYEDRFATRDNRLRLRGTMRPHSIARWFGPWWAEFWKDYTFSGVAPECAVDVRGNWIEGHRNIVTGWGRATQGTIRGQPYDELDLRFFIRPNYFDLFDVTLARPEGRLSGQLQLFFRPGSRLAAWQQFEFDSSVDLVELAQIFGEGGEEMFAPYRYDVPPQVVGRGRIEHQDGKFDTRLELAIDTEHEFRYHDFPFESLETDVIVHNRNVNLPRIHAGYASGFIDGTAAVKEGRLWFDAALTRSEFDTAVEVFTDYLNRRSPPTPEELEEDSGGFAGKKVGGRLDLSLAAQGPLTDFKSYTGEGAVTITEADLGSIKLFGLLVDVLGSVGIKAGILSFHTATSSLLVRQDQLLFPEVRITGNTAALTTSGTYSLNDRSVEFRAKLFPLRESSGAISQIVGVVLDPFSNLLGVRLTGTLRKPRWIPTLAPSTTMTVVDDPAAGNQQSPLDEAVVSPFDEAGTPASETDAPPETESSEPAPEE